MTRIAIGASLFGVSVYVTSGGDIARAISGGVAFLGGAVFARLGDGKVTE